MVSVACAGALRAPRPVEAASFLGNRRPRAWLALADEGAQGLQVRGHHPDGAGAIQRGAGADHGRSQRRQLLGGGIRAAGPLDAPPRREAYPGADRAPIRGGKLPGDIATVVEERGGQRRRPGTRPKAPGGKAARRGPPPRGRAGRRSPACPPGSRRFRPKGAPAGPQARRPSPSRAPRTRRAGTGGFPAPPPPGARPARMAAPLALSMGRGHCAPTAPSREPRRPAQRRPCCSRIRATSRRTHGP